MQKREGAHYASTPVTLADGNEYFVPKVLYLHDDPDDIYVTLMRGTGLYADALDIALRIIEETHDTLSISELVSHALELTDAAAYCCYAIQMNYDLDDAEIEALLTPEAIVEIVAATLDLPALLADHGIDLELTLAARSTR